MVSAEENDVGSTLENFEVEVIEGTYTYDFLNNLDINTLSIEYYGGMLVEDSVHIEIVNKINEKRFSEVVSIIRQHNLSLVTKTSTRGVGVRSWDEIIDFQRMSWHILRSLNSGASGEGMTTINGTYSLSLVTGIVTPIGAPILNVDVWVGAGITTNISNISVFYIRLNNNRGLRVSASYNLTGHSTPFDIPIDIFQHNFGRISVEHTL